MAAGLLRYTVDVEESQVSATHLNPFHTSLEAYAAGLLAPSKGAEEMPAIVENAHVICCYPFWLRELGAFRPG